MSRGPARAHPRPPASLPALRSHPLTCASPCVLFLKVDHEQSCWSGRPFACDCVANTSYLALCLLLLSGYYLLHRRSTSHRIYCMKCKFLKGAAAGTALRYHLPMHDSSGALHEYKTVIDSGNLLCADHMPVHDSSEEPYDVQDLRFQV